MRPRRSPCLGFAPRITGDIIGLLGVLGVLHDREGHLLQVGLTGVRKRRRRAISIKSNGTPTIKSVRQRRVVGLPLLPVWRANFRVVETNIYHRLPGM